jgi:hypothetical protein
MEFTPEFIIKYATVNAIPTATATTIGINIDEMKIES